MLNTTKPLIYQVLPRLYGNRTTANVHDGDVTQNGVGKMNDFTDKQLTPKQFGQLRDNMSRFKRNKGKRK